jgi:hypothetical protein
MNLFSNKHIIVYFVIFFGLYLGYISTGGKKSQNIRLLDIFIIGPVMIFSGYTSFISNYISLSLLLYNNKNIKTLLLLIISILLVFSGAATITYNMKNYFYFINDN